jgi:carboxymethylenebutenolidase
VGSAVILEASDGHRLDAYQAVPAGPPRGAVVIVQEIFGLNHHVRAVVDQYASLGFAAIAPALFDRVEPGVDLGYTAEGTQEGRALRGQIGWDAPLLDLEAAARSMRRLTGRAPAVIGYCWGGSLAWLMACRSAEVACSIGYYGAQIVQFLGERPRVPVQLHFGERDALIPPGDVEAIGRAHPEAEIFTYPADHGFNCSDRPAHDPGAASLALERSLEFLQRSESGRIPTRL